MKVLDIGCGRKKVSGAVGVDLNPRTDADVIHDLNVFPYPFQDGEFDEVYCDSILEHLENFFQVMEELHRVTVAGGIIRVKVPHYTSFDAYTDPTHRHFFTSRSFDYFREDYAYNYYTTARFEILDIHLTFLRLKQLGGISPHKCLGIEWFANRWIKLYEAFFAYIFPAHILSCTLQVVK
ncbi:SAM-dependent methyltransferase [candidate division KSB3 bacterium]|uniref:SAM-dependent methyltransferase n=1 Tax=candidate division KSB3 bacterium TaxID=2044937 RepID=A0A2G6E4Y4_9BACT|nr:MAG: SAM-dependent methyltransferase [candidate division KSB3 bacterium]